MISPMELKQIIKKVVTIGEEATFVDATAKMISSKTNSLLVIDTDGVLVGEICVPDLLQAVVPAYLNGDSTAAHFASEAIFDEAIKEAADKKVHDFMETNITTIHEAGTLMEVAISAIGQKRSRITIVDGDNRPVGIVSRRGIKQILADKLNITDLD